MPIPADPKLDQSFGQYLVERGVLSRKRFDEILALSRRDERPLIDYLTETPEADPETLYQSFALQLNLPFERLSGRLIPQEVISRIPIKIAAHYGFAPLSIQGRQLTLAAPYPLSLKIKDEICLLTGLEVKQVIAVSSEVTEALRRSYGMAARTVDLLVSRVRSGGRGEAEIASIAESETAASDTSVVELVNEIILGAFRRRATDIHLEPFRGSFRLRYRVDGRLSDANLSSKAVQLIHPVISRIKIMSNLDIVERRRPQDGRAIVKIGDQKLDLRVSCIPTPMGESIVVRVLQVGMTFDLQALGLSEHHMKIIDEIIRRPHGIFLVTGPTGSGKTTTLYSCLNRIRTDEMKVVSIEDPVEYEMQGITQIQVDPKVGLTFSQGLRSMLRHDPDIMMVGEIRDLETAEIAIRAALTGHLIFSTLHTNDAASGLTRLMDIGVEPFLVTSSVQAIAAQRLVRTICPQCKRIDARTPDSVKERIMADLAWDRAKPFVLYEGAGCAACSMSGYFGRTAIQEILVMDGTLKDLVMRKASDREVRKAAASQGMVSLIADGWAKAAQGLTTVGEVLRAVQEHDGD